MLSLHSTRRVAWCLLAACLVLGSAAGAKDLKLKAVKLNEQTVEAPAGSGFDIPAPTPAGGAGATADIGADTPTMAEFRFDLFANHLHSRLDGRTVGYEFAIYQGQTLRESGAGGFAMLSPQASMTAGRKISIGSTSKTITAAAVLRAIGILNARGEAVTLDSPMADYLPSAWKKGPHVDEITLRDLLSHQSGYRVGRDLFDELKTQIVVGPSNAHWNARHDGYYCNSNYTLFRIIIPYMIHGRSVMEGPKYRQAGKLEDSLEMRTARAYVEFVQDEVLAKVGLGNGKVGIAPTGPAQEITYYNFDNQAETFPGYSYQTALRGVGAGFWFMAAKEYGAFITGLRAGQIVPAAAFNAMKQDSLGMFDGTSEAGTTYWHNGAFTYGKAGMRGAWMMFPGNITAVVYYNSVDWNAGTTTEAMAAPQDILRGAFNDARGLQTLAVEP